MKHSNLSGKKFERWTVEDHIYGSYWSCRCDCGNIGKIQAFNLVKGNSKSCGCLRKELLSRPRPNMIGEKHPRWSGGYIDKEGYRRLRKNGKQIGEHRFVMEQYLKRSLKLNENVHHINGNRSDNRLENLELWSSSQPSGQRLEDKLAWAKELLSEYKKAI